MERFQTQLKGEIPVKIFNEAEKENGNPQTNGQPQLKFVVASSL